MATFLNVFDLTRKKTAVLQNAFDIVETHELNQIYSLSFTISAEDEKVRFLQPRHYVRCGETGELYRIKAPKYSESDTSTITYECEHVITTLCDTIMFGSYNFGGAGLYTSDVIEALLSRQTVKNWRLGTCAFRRQFEYLWEQENILNALYSVPKEFSAPYMWTFDTITYPWTINLVEIDQTINPQYYLRAKSNILASGSAADYANICTRIYPLGYGEGVNQLTIEDATVLNGEVDEVNGTRYGKKYIDAPAAYQDKYGIVEKVLVDRRFEHANTLYAYAKSMLDVYQEPTMSRSFDVTDLYPLTGQSWDDAEVGKICRMTQDETTAYITKTQRRLDQAGDLKIDLSTKATDIASNVADLADRVRIESVYAQGATQLYQHSKDANATTTKGMVISLYFPSEMRQINKVLLKVELGRFRAYSQTTASGGGSTATSTSGGGTTATSSSGGGSTATSSSGGGTGSTGASTGAGGFSATAHSTSGAVWENTDANVNTANIGKKTGSATSINNVGYTYTEGPGSPIEYYDSHTHRLEDVPYHEHLVTITNIQTSVAKRDFAHAHDISISLSGNQTSHSHSFSLSAHTHSVNIPAHTHNVTIPAHSHSIVPGIYESSEMPTQFDIYVNNTKKVTVDATSYNGDITTWLLNNKNLVPRNQWINVEIRPNALAYVVSSVFVQGFVQSRGGGNY